MPMYAEAFESMHALDRLQDFSSRFGAQFYGLPINEGSITMEKAPQAVARELDYADASAFTRAFRRWSGTTPAQWRKNRKAAT